MKTYPVILILSLLIGASSALADNKNPDSLVQCLDAVPDILVTSRSIAEPVGNVPQCDREQTCATCIKELKSMGCKVTDLSINQPGPTADQPHTVLATYALSCYHD